MLRIELDTQQYNTFIKVYDGDKLITDRAYVKVPNLKDGKWHLGLLTQSLDYLGIAYEVKETDWLEERLKWHGNGKN